MAAVFSAAELIAAAEASAPAVDLDVGGIGVTIDDGAGIPRSDDIRPPPDFVARPVDILGLNPHDRVVDYRIGLILQPRQGMMALD